MKYSEAISKAILESLDNNPNLIMLGQDVRQWGGAGMIYLEAGNRYPNNIYDTPISEAATAGIAVGLAMNGMRSIVEFSFLDFALHAMDPIINQAAKVHFMSNGQFDAPVVFRAAIASRRGYGASHSASYEAMFAQVPDLTVVYPSDPSDAYQLMKDSLNANKPVLFLDHKSMYDDESKLEKRDSIGKARIVESGDRVTIVTYGEFVKFAVQAINESYDLKERCDIIDLRSISPIDFETIISSLNKTEHLVIYEEGTGFLGDHIIANLIKNPGTKLSKLPIHLHAKMESVPANWEREFNIYPSQQELVDAVRMLMLKRKESEIKETQKKVKKSAAKLKKNPRSRI